MVISKPFQNSGGRSWQINSNGDANSDEKRRKQRKSNEVADERNAAAPIVKMHDAAKPFAALRWA